MRLVVLGWPHLDRSWKNDVAYAARWLGWRVSHLQPDRVTTDEVVEACRWAGLLIWARTHGKDPRGDCAAMLRAVERHGTATMGVHLDLYWGVPHREDQIGRHPWWTCQTVWTADGGRRPWASRGVNHRWLPPPAPDRYVGYGIPRPESAADVVFVGGVSRVHAGRTELINWARRRYGARFTWWGKAGRGPIWGADLNNLYASARVVLGDSVSSPRYWSDRVPAVAGRGGVLVHPAVDGLAEQGYTPDVVATYRRGDLDQLAEVIDGLLDDPGRCAAMRKAGVELHRTRHLWRHRLLTIAEEVL